MRINLANHLSSKFIILFLSITFCSGSGVDESKLATDSEMVWCLSQETYVQAGTFMIESGSDSAQVGGVSFFEDEAVKAREVSKTLLNSIRLYEFLETDNPGVGFMGEIDYRNKLDWASGYVYKSKNLYYEALEMNYVDGNWSSYTNRVFIHWSNIKKAYENNNQEFDKDSSEFYNTEINYINAYSICKLWYDSSN